MAAVTKLTDHKLEVNNALLTVLGTVLGLVVSAQPIVLKLPPLVAFNFLRRV